jgi:hypothetical protein
MRDDSNYDTAEAQQGGRFWEYNQESEGIDF